MIHYSDKQRYDCGHNIYIKKAQHSEADKIFFRVSAYESFKSKLTSNSPVNLKKKSTVCAPVGVETGFCDGGRK